MIKKKSSIRMLVFFIIALLLIGLLPSAVLADESEQVRVIIENTKYSKAKGASWEGVLVDTWVDLSADSSMMSCIGEALEDNGYTAEGMELGYISKINGLAAGAPDYMSGWMILLNDWFINAGADSFWLENGDFEAGDEIRVSFSLDGGEDLGGNWSDDRKTLISLSSDQGELSPAFDSQTREYILNVPEDTESVQITPTATNKNYMVKTYLGTQESGKEYKRNERIPVEEGTVITVVCGDPSWPSMSDNEGEKAVYTLTVHKQVKVKQAHVIVENTKYGKSEGAPWEGVLVDTWVDLNDESTLLSSVQAALDASGYSAVGIDTGYITGVNGLSAGTPDYMSGWMVLLNDWFTSETADTYTVSSGTLSDGDEIRVSFSKDYGADLGGTWENNLKTIKEIKLDNGVISPKFDSETTNYTLILSQSVKNILLTPVATNKNYMVKTYLGTQESGTEYKRNVPIPVEEGTVITVVCGDSSWPTMNGTEGDKKTYTFTVSYQDLNLPQVPETASAQLYGAVDVNLNWSKSEGAQGFHVYYRMEQQDSFVYAGKTTKLTYKQAGLNPGVKYIFKIVPYTIIEGMEVESPQGAQVEMTTLKKPENLEVASVSGTKVVLTWDDMDGQSGYQISKTLKASDTANTATFALTDVGRKELTVTRGVPYYYKVRAYTKNGSEKIYGPWSDAVLFTNSLSAPTGVKAVLYGYDDVKVSWNKVSGASGYAVYYKKASSESFTLLKRLTGTSIKKSNLSDGIAYQFKVVPYYKSGNTRYLSENQKTVSVTTLKKPAKPMVESVSPTQIKLTWDDMDGQSGYQISKSTSSSKTTIISTIASETQETKTLTVKAGSVYYYKVRAYTKVGSTTVYGPWSSAVKFTNPLLAPENITAELYGYDDVKVSWNKVKDASGYAVYYKKASSSKYTLLKYTTSTYVKRANLSDGIQYTFKVVPYYKSGVKRYLSDNYGTASVYTLKKMTLETALNGNGQVLLNWKDFEGQSGYQISKSEKSDTTQIAATISDENGENITLEAQNGVPYYYKVRAFKTVGSENIYGPWSKAVMFINPLPSPENLSISVSETQVANARWDAVDNASGYAVYLKKDAGSYKLYKRTTETSIGVSGLTTQSMYSLKVVPYYKVGSTRHLSENSAQMEFSLSAP